MLFDILQLEVRGFQNGVDMRHLSPSKFHTTGLFKPGQAPSTDGNRADSRILYADVRQPSQHKILLRLTQLAGCVNLR